eukprot:4451636-Pleurochrysis_carterae.AAC.2
MVKGLLPATSHLMTLLTTTATTPRRLHPTTPRRLHPTTPLRAPALDPVDAAVAAQGHLGEGDFFAITEDVAALADDVVAASEDAFGVDQVGGRRVEEAIRGEAGHEELWLAVVSGVDAVRVVGGLFEYRLFLHHSWVYIPKKPRGAYYGLLLHPSWVYVITAPPRETSDLSPAERASTCRGEGCSVVETYLRSPRAARRA